MFLIQLSVLVPADQDSYLLPADEKGNDELDLSTSDEWDLRTVTSALKLYLR